tara:strand:+ start:436 stop:639 length:204 start_codon:yes stop_codon:yes gene_type:complete
MVRLAVEDLIERLDVTIEVLKESDKAGVETLIEGVQLAKAILSHYVKPFTYRDPEDLKRHIDKLDRP